MSSSSSKYVPVRTSTYQHGMNVLVCTSTYLYYLDWYILVHTSAVLPGCIGFQMLGQVADDDSSSRTQDIVYSGQFPPRSQIFVSAKFRISPYQAKQHKGLSRLSTTA